MLDLLIAAPDAFCCFLELIELVAGLLEAVAFRQSRDSRRARRAAKREGVPLPPRDRWHQWFLILTVFVVLLGLLLAPRWIVRLSDWVMGPS